MTTRAISADSAMAHGNGLCCHCHAIAGSARVMGICFPCWDSGVRHFSDGTTRNEADPHPQDALEACPLASIIFDLDNL